MSDDNKSQLARDWFAVQEKLSELKEHERMLREQMVSSYFGDNLDAGTHRERISEKALLVVSIPKKITIDKDFFEEHKSELIQKGFIGDDRLIKVKYEASATAFKHLSEPDKAKFGEIFVHSTGSPQVKIEIAKG